MNGHSPLYPPCTFGGGLSRDAAQNMPYQEANGNTPGGVSTTTTLQVQAGDMLRYSFDIPDGLAAELGDALNRSDLCLDEGRKLHYTAVTGDADSFFPRYGLYQNYCGRRTELMIVVTMYNVRPLAGVRGSRDESDVFRFIENEFDFCRTMNGVFENIYSLCGRRKKGECWGADSWKQIVVCVIADGTGSVNEGTLAFLSRLGAYQRGISISKFSQSQAGIEVSKDVSMHLYEYTTLCRVPSPDKPMDVSGAPQATDLHVPVQILFGLKQKNSKKINSHRWCLNAFGRALRPEVVVLLDVGTRPLKHAFLNLHRSFVLDKNLGGCCGEIIAYKGKWWHSIFTNPLVAAQNFEYKMSNILDKSLESVFGFVTVLPGAFCAYRYAALQDVSPTEGPLFEYFKGEKMHSPELAVAAGSDLDAVSPTKPAGFFQKNMYLAEDRILCWELVSKRNASWTLMYQSAARATTDVPSQVGVLIKQRRRWLNGSFFANLHALWHIGYIFRSNHGVLRKTGFIFQWFYQVYSTLFAWFALGNYYITLSIISRSITDPAFRLPTQTVSIVGDVARWVYLALVGLCFILALGNRPEATRGIYFMIMGTFGVITAAMIAAVTWIIIVGVQNFITAVHEAGSFNIEDVFENKIFRNIVLSVTATLVLQFGASILFADFEHMFTCLLQYLMLAPTYINVFNVYAFANLHDHTWGNRPEAETSENVAVATPVHPAGIVTMELNTNQAFDDAGSELQRLHKKHLQSAAQSSWWKLQRREKKAPAKMSVKEREEVMTDSYKATRTWIILSWALCNTALVASITSTRASQPISTTNQGHYVSIYMTILLYSVAGLALVRALGCVIFRIKLSGTKNIYRAYRRAGKPWTV